jgi:hypothetical protein
MITITFRSKTDNESCKNVQIPKELLKYSTLMKYDNEYKNCEIKTSIPIGEINQKIIKDIVDFYVKLPELLKGGKTERIYDYFKGKFHVKDLNILLYLTKTMKFIDMNESILAYLKTKEKIINTQSKLSHVQNLQKNIVDNKKQLEEVQNKINDFHNKIIKHYTVKNKTVTNKLENIELDKAHNTVMNKIKNNTTNKLFKGIETKKQNFSSSRLREYTPLKNTVKKNQFITSKRVLIDPNRYAKELEKQIIFTKTLNNFLSDKSKTIKIDMSKTSGFCCPKRVNDGEDYGDEETEETSGKTKCKTKCKIEEKSQSETHCGFNIIDPKSLIQKNLEI